MLKITLHDNGAAPTGMLTDFLPFSRRRAYACTVFVFLLPGWAAVQAADFNPDLPYPVQVAVSKEPQGYVYRRFPGNQRLYISDADKNGQSACNSGCDTAYVPVYAPADAKPLGDWSAIQRNDGRKQWAYRGQPVYTYFHDAPEEPSGEKSPGWHMLPYER
jgi:predicted lipoprotein with Yx(FWY)xxD motif